MAGSCLSPGALLLASLLFLTDVLPTTIGSIDALTNTSTVRTAAGETAYLTCHLPGAPNDKIYWARQQVDNIFLTHKRRFGLGAGRIKASCSRHDDSCLLTIRSVQKTDSGLYHCGVDSNPSVRRSVYLSVFVSEPEPTILGEPFRSHWQGSGINLTCIVQPRLRPDDTVVWQHNDLVIDSLHDSRLAITRDTDTSTVSHLLIMDAQPKDSGTYTCRLPSGSSDSVDVDVMQGDGPTVYIAVDGTLNTDLYFHLYSALKWILPPSPTPLLQSEPPGILTLHSAEL